ncbi:hypothetical protein ACHQM5_000415 [Ranunculus cassubicifolius]
MLVQNRNRATEQIGSRGWTSLHHAAYNNNTEVIDLLIKYCPDCCKVVNYAGRNFLHIAAEHERVGVVRYALGLGSEKLPYAVLNRQADDGNTPLHIAALKENKSLTECLLYDNRVSKTTTNVHGQKVLDAIHFDYDKVKAGVFGSKEISQKMMKEQGEFDLVVSALIAAVTFTAGITIPGGYFSDGPSQGMAVLSKRAPFFAFVISNNFALMFSLYAVFSHFCARRLLTIEDTVYQLNVATRCTFGAIFDMMVAFITGSYIVLASSRVLSIVACVQCCCFFVFAANAMSKMVPSHVRFWKKIKETSTSSNGFETV